MREEGSDRTNIRARFVSSVFHFVSSQKNSHFSSISFLSCDSYITVSDNLFKLLSLNLLFNISDHFCT